MHQRPALTVIVPAYNEADRIGDSLGRIATYLAARDAGSEIVVVDDGSRDATSDTVRRTAAGAGVPVRLLRYADNRGKGHALRVGFAHSRGERVLFTDADLSVPIETLDRLLAALDLGADVAFGSRSLAESDISVRQPRLREWLGGVFTWLVRVAIGPVSDATCGFKAFGGDVGRALFANLRRDDWSFDAELVYAIRRKGLTLAEVPVQWEHREGTKVRPLRDGLRALWGLLAIRLGPMAPPAVATRPLEACSSEAVGAPSTEAGR